MKPRNVMEIEVASDLFESQLLLQPGVLSAFKKTERPVAWSTKGFGAVVGGGYQ
jgi:hypothetical protein